MTGNAGVLAGWLRAVSARGRRDAASPAGGTPALRSVVLDARWNVREPGRAAVAHHDRIVVNVASLDAPQIATGLSQALAGLADRMTQ